ncbi:MAG TPA: hypothetical protein VH761_01040, partial [Ilumatobacteraceae bacterium]
DFQLIVDGTNVAQNVAMDVAAGTHTIDELPRDGYVQVAIVCVDLDTFGMWALDGDVVEIASGQHVGCVVTNHEQPATLTLTKFVDNVNGGNLTSSDFQLQIDGNNVSQNVANELAAGSHTISEVPVDGYSLVGIECTDEDSGAPVTYDAGVTLALGQHVTCDVFNDADPVDLVITKSVEAGAHVAGGDSFDYTLSIDNLGPRDVDLGEAVVVTDRLPSGLEFVSYPSNCTAAGQELTCDLDPADLEVSDPPIVLTVTVHATAGALSGNYTNMSFVNTPDDPACVGTECVPSCDTQRNNVSCATTEITRDATVTIDKVDNVTGSVHPGGTYSYFITVGNSGPSTLLSGNVIVTDDLPAGLSLVSVDGPAPWACGSTDPVTCTYGATLDPGTSAPVITITVKVDGGFVGSSILNEASVAAVVDLIPDSPGKVVTAKDDETTAVVREADMSIDKSASVTSATVGTEFDWIIDITNHGPDTATNVVVNDALPAAFQVISVSATGGLSCTSTVSSVQCTSASMANGATARITIHVAVIATATAGPTTNSATVSSDPGDLVTGNNSDAASIVVNATSSQAPVPPGTTGSGT